MREANEIKVIHRTSRILFRPFFLSQGKDQTVFRCSDSTEYLEFDAVGGNIINYLDSGQTISETQHEVEKAAHMPVDVVSFVDELEHLGYVTILGPDATHGGSVRVFLQPRMRTHFFWWWGFFALALASCTFNIAVFFAHPLPWPPISALVLPDVPFLVTLVVLFLIDLTSNVFHEGAHFLVGWIYGLAPRFRLGRRGFWFVVETDVTGVWELKRTWRWRPLLAGLMSDITLIAVALLISLNTGSQSLAFHITRSAVVLILAKMLWQCQWYLRTDLYFLWITMTDIHQIRQAAWNMISRRKKSESQQGIRNASSLEVMSYLMSLPIAIVTTVLLCLWFVFPIMLTGLRLVLPFFMG